MSKQILLSTLGLSPGVVTGAYFILEQEGYGRMDKIIGITTASAYAAPCQRLISKTLAQANPGLVYEQRLAVDEKELRDSAMTHRFTQFMRHLLDEVGPAYDQIHLNISGGRKSMVAAAMIAVQQYLSAQPQRSPQVHVYHLELLDDDIEENGSASKLSGMSRPQQARYLHPPQGSMKLVEVAVPPILAGPPELHKQLFTYATGAYLLEQKIYTQVRFNYRPETGSDETIDVYALETNLADDRPYVVDHARLRTLLTQRFSLNELHTLAQDLHVNADEIGEKTRTAFARELIAYLARRERLPDLLGKCQQRRAQEEWAAAVRQLPVLLVACQLRPISSGEVRRLADKMAALQAEQQRPVSGWLVSNTASAAADALALARAAGIVLQQAHWPQPGPEQVDWQITELTPIVTM